MPEVMNKICSYCGEEISSGSGRCPYCGSLLDVTVDGFTAQSPESMEQDPNLIESEPCSEQSVGIETAQSKTMALNQTSITGDTGVPQEKNQYRSPSAPVYAPEVFNKPMGNGLKVFLTIISTVIPGLGQLAGLITGIVLLNSERDPDRKSFGLALLVASIIFFVINCFFYLILAAALSMGSFS